jgi:hypothetical protein
MNWELIDYLCQAILVVTGICALRCMKSQVPQVRVTGAKVALFGELFWLATALINWQPGVLLLCLVYAHGWWGVYRENVKASETWIP